MLTSISSDARSAQVVDERLRPALETGSAIGSARPILAVIDEIDGATGGTDSVSRLFSFFLRSNNSNNGHRRPYSLPGLSRSSYN